MRCCGDLNDAATAVLSDARAKCGEAVDSAADAAGQVFYINYRLRKTADV